MCSEDAMRVFDTNLSRRQGVVEPQGNGAALIVQRVEERAGKNEGRSSFCGARSFTSANFQSVSLKLLRQTGATSTVSRDSSNCALRPSSPLPQKS